MLSESFKSFFTNYDPDANKGLNCEKSYVVETNILARMRSFGGSFGVTFFSYAPLSLQVSLDQQLLIRTHGTCPKTNPTMVGTGSANFKSQRLVLTGFGDGQRSRYFWFKTGQHDHVLEHGLDSIRLDEGPPLSMFSEPCHDMVNERASGRNTE
jgi:hypothetical protein